MIIEYIIDDFPECHMYQWVAYLRGRLFIGLPAEAYIALLFIGLILRECHSSLTVGII